ncbi:hypothetical protein TEA_029145 [Camellia sinensis var. sinensis]|uniref:DUF4050 domain-containing protein n=1 Tax=Camellia sinensis var. sinensis TaxID=542762 RepID=A0A4S4EAU9_CAMSN|nr:hypothetical protein TEA_029145 [Camellia sinensis var. sinensis]
MSAAMAAIVANTDRRKEEKRGNPLYLRCHLQVICHFPIYLHNGSLMEGTHFMQSNSCIQDLAAFQVSIPCNTTCPVSMEGNTGNFLSNEKQSLEVSTSDNEVKMLTENSGSTSVFVNHGKSSALFSAIAWQQNRKEWIGDQSQRSKRIQKDPIISLQEMVDFLVDIWLDDGLYDLDNQ